MATISKTFVAYFEDSSVPKTGLSPTIDVWDIAAASKVVTAQAMTEVGGGFYKYVYTSYDSTKEYRSICDGTATLAAAERYVEGGDFAPETESLVADAYDGAVWYDAASGTSGTTYPAGTKLDPVNDEANALAIVAATGLKTLDIRGAFTLPAATGASSLNIRGSRSTSDSFVFGGTGSVSGCVFTDLSISGTAGGSSSANTFRDCAVNALTHVVSGSAYLYRCQLSGQLSLRTNSIVRDCYGTATIYMSTYFPAVYGFVGDLTMTSITTGSPKVSMLGRLTLASSCTGGTLTVYTAGGVEIVDNSTGTTVDRDDDAISTRTMSIFDVAHGATSWVSADLTSLNDLSQADILSDATPFAGADVGAILTDTAAIQPTVATNLDAAISTRATAASIAALNDLSQADILSDATPFQGADVAAILADTAAMPTAATVADAVLEELIADHTSVSGSLAEAVMLAKGLVQDNFFLDTLVYNASNVMTSGRIRIYDTGANVGTGTGVLATLTVTATPNSTTTTIIDDYKVVRS